MNRQVYVVVLFTLLILYFTGCQKPAAPMDSSPAESYPESSPVEVTGKPGSKLHEICPAGVIKEDSQALDSPLVVFRFRLTLPEGCALHLENSVFHQVEDEFHAASYPASQSTYYLSYKVEKSGASMMKCVPQNSVWIKTDESFDDVQKSYSERYERLDIHTGAPKEILFLRGNPKPFPGHLVGIRKAVCY